MREVSELLAVREGSAREMRGDGVRARGRTTTRIRRAMRAACRSSANRGRRAREVRVVEEGASRRTRRRAAAPKPFHPKPFKKR